MSYVESLAKMILYTWYAVGVFGIYILIQEEVVWRVKDRYDRIKNPVKYDRNIRNFKKWMRQGNLSYGIYIGATDSCRVINNVFHDCSVLTSPPKYQEI